MKPTSKTVWQVFVNDTRLGGNMTKARALQVAMAYHLYDEAVSIRSVRMKAGVFGFDYLYGEVVIEFMPGSWPVQYGQQGKRTRGKWAEPKYLRGYGKLGKPMRRKHK